MIDGVGEVAAYHVAPALWADQAFDHSGGHFGDFARRHQEDGGDFGGDVAVDVAHRAFVFVVGGGTDAADDEIGVDFAGVIDQKRFSNTLMRTLEKGWVMASSMARRSSMV